MPTSKKDREKSNWRRRRNRRPEDIGDFDAVTLFKECPTLTELKDALREARVSSEGILRMAALMDNLAAYHAPRFECDGLGIDESTPFRGRTNGIRKFLEQDGYLRSRYATLMRYKRLAERIRAKIGHLKRSEWIVVNLLWGFETQCPEELAADYGGEEYTPYSAMRKLYASLAGLNFKEIEQKLAQ